VPHDLDPADTAAVRRRVVEPVVKSLIRPDELERIDVRVASARTAHEERAEATLIVSISACSEVIEVYLGTLSEEALGRFPDSRLPQRPDENELSETRFAWGEQRTGNYSKLPPTWA
jgi:hypothetical protein